MPGGGGAVSCRVMEDIQKGVNPYPGVNPLYDKYHTTRVNPVYGII